eukprot:1410034-Pyramimonas_sp.AAC.1
MMMIPAVQLSPFLLLRWPRAPPAGASGAGRVPPSAARSGPRRLCSSDAGAAASDPARWPGGLCAPAFAVWAP